MLVWQLASASVSLGSADPVSAIFRRIASSRVKSVIASPSSPACRFCQPIAPRLSAKYLKSRRSGGSAAASSCWIASASRYDSSASPGLPICACRIPMV